MNVIRRTPEAQATTDSFGSGSLPEASYTITLKDMRFHALVGVYPHEAEFPQPLEVDLSVDVRNVPGAVVDYTRLYADVTDVVMAGHIGYIEEIAERIAERVLKVPEVQTARISVRKPHVALPGPLAYAEVSISRSSARSVTGG